MCAGDMVQWACRGGGEDGGSRWAAALWGTFDTSSAQRICDCVFVNVSATVCRPTACHATYYSNQIRLPVEIVVVFAVVAELVVLIAVTSD